MSKYIFEALADCSLECTSKRTIECYMSVYVIFASRTIECSELLGIELYEHLPQHSGKLSGFGKLHVLRLVISFYGV
jgi:hypothetical protein